MTASVEAAFAPARWSGSATRFVVRPQGSSHFTGARRCDGGRRVRLLIVEHVDRAVSGEVSGLARGALEHD